MKKARFVIPVGLFSFLALLTISCEKNNLSPASESLSDTDIELVKDELTADDIFNEIDAVVLSEIQVLEENDYQSASLKSTDEDYPCLEVTVDHPDTTRFPKVITFDYGNGCTFIINGDTISKKGAIVVTLTDKIYNTGAQRIVTFRDYAVNEIKVEGVFSSTYNGVNENDLLEYTTTLEKGKLIFNETIVYTREGRHKREWYRSRIPIEDTVFISGSAWGVNIVGEEYSREIADRLTLAHCPSYVRRWVIVDGQVISTIGGTETIIDYSEGGCDGTAVIERNGRKHRLRIRERHRFRNRIHSGN